MCTGVILAFFHLAGKVLCWILWLHMYAICFAIAGVEIRRVLADMLSRPVALFESKLERNLCTNCSVTGGVLNILPGVLNFG